MGLIEHQWNDEFEHDSFGLIRFCLFDCLFQFLSLIDSLLVEHSLPVGIDRREEATDDEPSATAGHLPDPPVSGLRFSLFVLPCY